MKHKKLNRKKIGIILGAVLLTALVVLLIIDQANRMKRREREAVEAAERARIEAQEAAEMAVQAIPEEEFLRGLTLGDQYLIYDAENRTYYYSIPEAASEGLNPAVTADMEEGVSLTFVSGSESGEKPFFTPEQIASGKPVEIRAARDGVEQTYYLQATTLPILTMNFEGSLSSEDRMVDLMLYDNRSDAEETVITSAAEVRYRGATTREYPKKGLKISLKKSEAEGGGKNKERLLGMRKDDDWILYAGYNDQERVRNVFCTNLWYDTCAKDNSFDADNGDEYRYVELFLNDHYWGLYALGYPIDEKQTGIDPEEGGVMFKKVDWSDEHAVNVEEGPVEGYELKSDPLPDGLDSWAPLRAYYRSLAEDQKDLGKIASWIDWNTSMDLYLFIDLIQGVDQGGSDSTKNLYLSMFWDNDHYRILYTPWDMDLTWSNTWSFTLPNNVEPYAFTPDYCVKQESGAINELLISDPKRLGQVAAQYQKLRQGGWSDEAIGTMLDDLEAKIFSSGAYARDIIRWPESTQLEDPAVKLSRFRTYVQERLDYQDACYASVAAQTAAGGGAMGLMMSSIPNAQSAAYVLVIGDREELLSENNRDLVNLLGVDVSQITPEVNLVLRSAEGEIEYRSFQCVDTENFNTAAGEVLLARSRNRSYGSRSETTFYLNNHPLGDLDTKNLRPYTLWMLTADGEPVEFKVPQHYYLKK